MSCCRPRFNLYLLSLACCLLVAGCADTRLGRAFHRKKEQIALVRVHVESEGSRVGATSNISILRSQPVAVNISTDPILTEADLLGARLLDAPGGFAVELKLNNMASWRLEQCTAVNPGKHLAIFGQWGEKPADGRWLAAPLIVRRQAGDTLTFTPDASHAEMEPWVKGLNDLAKKNAGVKSAP